MNQKEETENTAANLLELKKSTYASYIGKAARGIRANSRLSKDFENDYYSALRSWNKAYDAGDKKKMDHYDTMMRTNDSLEKDFKKKAAKRILGVSRAAQLLAKEEIYYEEWELIAEQLIEACGRKHKKKMAEEDEELEMDVNEDATNNKSDDGEGMDKPMKSQALKKFKARKDKDIDNDGDTDKSDKYLHNRRQKITKAMEDD